MEFEETKYVSIELTAEEKVKLDQAKDIIDELIDYMQEHNKNILEYRTYDGTEEYSLDGLKRISGSIEDIYNIECVE